MQDVSLGRRRHRSFQNETLGDYQLDQQGRRQEQGSLFRRRSRPDKLSRLPSCIPSCIAIVHVFAWTSGPPGARSVGPITATIPGSYIS